MVIPNSTRRAFLGGCLSAAAVTGAQDLCSLTLEQAADLVRRKKASPVELTRACLRRIDTLNPTLNAFITVTAEEALAQAREREAEFQAGRSRGMLHGIPIALKDLVDTAGVRTTAGSAHYANRVPASDAEVVTRLKDAGAVLLGKLNMDEFAYNYTSETSYFGVCRNPWDKRLSPGGSSGGSAVAVASGMCFAALGSDTGGSIRLPAAFCGISGLKPSYGRVSTRGVAPLAWSLDHVGPMCRTTRDAAWVLSSIDGGKTGAQQMLARDVKPLRLGVPRAVFFEQLKPEAGNIVEDAMKALGALAAGIRDVTLPPLAPSPEIPVLPFPYITIISVEAYAFHEEMLKRDPGKYHAGTRRSIEGGAGVTAAEYARALREMEQLRAGSGRLFEHADLLITPTAPGPAFELGKPGGLIYLRNSAPWNLYGLPSISIPCGFTKAGLPVGLQITGPAGRDDLVLSLAAAYQRSTEWHTRRPA